MKLGRFGVTPMAGALVVLPRCIADVYVLKDVRTSRIVAVLHSDHR